MTAATPARAQRAFGASDRDARQFDESFRKYTKRFFGVGFDWQVFKAQAMAESELDPQAHNHTGARGLMQLMPSTFRQIQSQNPDFKSIDDPEWNIAAGIQYDRTLWNLWNDHEADPDRQSFTFASYNAGRGTILRAQAVARRDSLDHLKWASIEAVAPRVLRWRHQETLAYLRKIQLNHDSLAGTGPDGKPVAVRPGRRP
jgi:membrane-bound lytic murein transglycosylase MltF